MDTIAKEPKDIPLLFIHFWNNRDAKGIASLFVEDAEFINVVGLWWHDRNAIFKAHDYGLKQIFNKSTVELRKTKVKFLQDNIAIVHARMKLSNQTEINQVNKPGDRKNIFTFVVQKENDRWLCVAAHNTDVVPGKETHIVNEKGEITAVDYRK